MTLTARLTATAGLLVCLTGCLRTETPAVEPKEGSTKYHAVFLDSGAVFFGRLTGLGTEYPVLTEVFYVQSGTNAETKQVTNVLVKRGREWHGPDRMTLNASHILFVEPVGPDSQVAKLIAQAK